MSEEKGLVTEDRERLERYRKWRRAQLKRRAARRRQWFRYVAVVCLAVMGLALVTWRVERARDARTRIVSEPRTAPSESAAITSHEPAPRALSPEAAETVIKRTPAEAQRVEPRRTLRSKLPARASRGSAARKPPPRERSAPSSPSTQDPAPVRDVAVGAEVPSAPSAFDFAVSTQPSSTPTAVPPVSAPASALLDETAADPSQSIATETPTSPTPDDPQTVPPPPLDMHGVAAAAPANVPDAAPGPGCAGGSVKEARQPRAAHTQARGQVVADCVVGWLKGEMQEFRDGMRREIDELRAGFDRVRGALQRLRSELRHSE